MFNTPIADANTKPLKASGFLDKNPFTRLGKSYVNLLGSVLEVDTIYKKKYWDQVLKTSNEAIARTVGVIGDSANDIARTVNVTEAEMNGYTPNPNVLQCTSDLPIFPQKEVGYVEGLRSVTQVKHTWLQIGSESFGMASTISQDYLGGAAFITKPDSLQRANKQGVVCAPILQKQETSQIQFQKNISCIANRAAFDLERDWLTTITFDYHVFKNNCLSAVRFITECAEGKISQVPNFGIGGEFSWQQVALQYFRTDDLIKEHNKIYQQIDNIDSIFAEALKTNPNIQPEQFLLLINKELELLKNTLIQIKNDRTKTKNNTVWLKPAIDHFGSISLIKKYSDIYAMLIFIVQQSALEYEAYQGKILGQEISLAHLCQDLRSKCNILPQ
ncbi:MAG: hypothetical protein ACOYOK_13725 [Pseudobdellovibrionaceae bacterium]